MLLVHAALPPNAALRASLHLLSIALHSPTEHHSPTDVRYACEGEIAYECDGNRMRACHTLVGEWACVRECAYCGSDTEEAESG